jgi:RNA:NAD 2'-phosphotransferase (TPT1/KptA family)
MNPSDFIAKYSIRRFYHFTERANLDSIRKHGLLSLAELSRLQIQNVHFSSSPESRSVDSHYGLDDYVRLSFVDQHPMEYVAKKEGRIKDSVFLPINCSVVLQDGIKVAGGVAYGHDVPIYELAEACEKLDFDIIYLRSDWKDPAIKARLMVARKYELLVPKCIPTTLIRGL